MVTSFLLLSTAQDSLSLPNSVTKASPPLLVTLPLLGSKRHSPPKRDPFSDPIFLRAELVSPSQAYGRRPPPPFIADRLTGARARAFLSTQVSHGAKPSTKRFPLTTSLAPGIPYLRMSFLSLYDILCFPSPLESKPLVARSFPPSVGQGARPITGRRNSVPSST